MNDLVVEEMRKYGIQFAARHDNNISKMCTALRAKETEFQHKVVNREPHRIEQRKAS